MPRSAPGKKVPRSSSPPPPAETFQPIGFDYGSIPAGFYQNVIETGHPVRRAWHLQKFDRVIECLPRGQGLSLLDIGCAAGTFLSRVTGDTFSEQVGVDIDAKQVAYAAERFSTPFRRFEAIRAPSELEGYGRRFDVVTLIEVVEHLTPVQVAELLGVVSRLLKPGGQLVLSTPNYTSAWPVLELVVNRLSEVSYEEQHITRLNYFSCVETLRRISPALARDFTLEMRTTTHFAAPYLAALSLPLSMRVSRLVDHKRWLNPFGALILLSFRRSFS